MKWLYKSFYVVAQVDDLEREKEGLEEKVKELARTVEEKTVDNLMLIKEKNTIEKVIMMTVVVMLMLSKKKNIIEQEHGARIAELVVEKEQLTEEQKKVVLKLISDGQKDKEKMGREMSVLKKEMEERDEKCNQLRIRVKESERLIEKKTEELELVRIIIIIVIIIIVIIVIIIITIIIVIIQVKVGQEEIRKRNEFRSNLERSFESLQKQFQAKVDELERVKKELGHDDNKRRRTSNEIRHTSER